MKMNQNALPLSEWFVGIKPSKLNLLPPEAAIATVQFSIGQDEMPDLSEAVSIFGGVTATLVEIPVEAVKAAYMKIPEYADYHVDFDAYHAWYVGLGNMPTYGTENRWPCIASEMEDDVVQDGSHRLHAYISAGHQTIPVLLYDYAEWWAAHASWMSAKESSQPKAKTNRMRA